jgi:predicted ATPase/DNA-binding SARP family transcriptional activator
VRFSILGPLVVTDSGVELLVGGPRHRALLAALLVHRGATVSANRLIDVLWGEDPPRSATEMLHVRISELRRALAGGPTHNASVVVTMKSGYRLVTEPDDVDADRFESLVLAGRAARDPKTAISLYVEALALWRGAALPELSVSAYARAETARLDDLRTQALEARMDAGLTAGQHLDLIPDLRALVIDDPLRERFWYQLMLALHRCGRSVEALEAYRQAHRAMVEELGIEPGADLRLLHTTILKRDLTAEERTRPVRAPNNLPANLSSFVGRHDDQEEIAGLLLGHTRLVTVTGVGGVGKSRLAVEIAAAHLNAYPDGVWLVELAPLTDPALLVPVVASVAGVREHPDRTLFDQIVRRFHSAGVLLVLDNCEHLVGEVAEFVRQLLDACPSLRVLCTSRERLRVPGEVLRPLSGLSTRSPKGAADAVTLFTQRARAVRVGFAVSEQTAEIVTQICERLDGLPLAIELAAARVGSYSPAQIAAGLDDRLRLLTRGSQVASPRHRTLRTVIDWSYDQLSDGERRVFERTSVFVGGFTFDAAEAVCIADEDLDLVDVLALLVDKSLVTADAAPSPEYRYRLLETLQAYAAEQRDGRGEIQALCRRHAVYYATLADAARTGLRSADQVSWLGRLASDHGNIRAALDFLLRDRDVETAGRVAGSIYPFWDLHGHYTEGRRWLNLVLAAGEGLTPNTHSRVLMGATTLAVIQGDVEAAVSACQAAAALTRHTGDNAGLAHAQQYLGFIAIYAEQFAEADGLIADSIAAAKAAGADWEHGWAYIFAATSSLAQGNNAHAVEMSRQADRYLAAVGDREAFAWSSYLRTSARWAAGDDPGGFVEELRRAITDFHELGALWGLSLGLLLAGMVMSGGDRTSEAVRVLGAAESARASMGAGIYPFVNEWLRTAIDRAEHVLGSVDFERGWRAGSATSIPDGVTAALDLLHHPYRADRMGSR